MPDGGPHAGVRRAHVEVVEAELGVPAGVAHLYSTVQYSTVQYSIQYSTARGGSPGPCPPRGSGCPPRPGQGNISAGCQRPKTRVMSFMDRPLVRWFDVTHREELVPGEGDVVVQVVDGVRQPLGDVEHLARLLHHLHHLLPVVPT